jgi:hypothetical protein
MKFTAVIMLACALVLTACGGSSNKSSNTDTTVTITVSPVGVSLGQNQSATFTATVSNVSNTTVTWQVNGIAGGNSSIGTITSAGVYTSPTTLTSAFSVTITAIAQTDTTKTATAIVALNPPATAPKSPITVSPSSATLTAGAQQTFTASVSGTTATVVWSVSCQSSIAGDCGSITQAGVYTAPLFPPSGGSALVTAETSDDSAKPGNAPITVQISNGSLFGQYAFQASGTSSAIAGSIKFDGQGNVTGGVQDVSGGASTAITGGTYHVGSDGRGSLSIQTAAGTTKWQVMMVNHSHILLESFDSAASVVSGAMDLQTAAELNASSFQGSYGFWFSGASASQPMGTLRAAGALAADGASAVTQGMMDVNDTGSAQTALSITGAFTAPATSGRGTLTLTTSAGTNTFTYYQVDASHLKIVETDANGKGAGELVKQAGSTFTNTSFAGTYVMALGGTNGANPVSTGGILVLDGQGGVKATIDTNNNGNVSASESLTGVYSVTDSASGRTTFTWTALDGPHQFVFYPAATNALNVLQLDTTSASGPGLSQRLSGFSNAAFTGNFAAQLNGIDFSGSAGPISAIGLLIPNGGSAVSGVLDVNDNGSVTAASINGSYLFDTTARATMTLNSSSSQFRTAQIILYGADTNSGVFIELDSNRVITGTMQKQY